MNNLTITSVSAPTSTSQQQTIEMLYEQIKLFPSYEKDEFMWLANAKKSVAKAHQLEFLALNPTIAKNLLDAFSNLFAQADLNCTDEPIVMKVDNGEPLKRNGAQMLIVKLFLATQNQSNG